MYKQTLYESNRSDTSLLENNGRARMSVTVAGPQGWTHEALDAMRTTGDSAADAAVLLWRQAYGLGRSPLLTMANRLVGFEASSQANDLIGILLAHHAELVPLLDPSRRARECGVSDVDATELSPAYDLFREHGLKILMILVFYSLPASYAAQNGVRVLHSDSGSTGYLVKDLNRRLIETTQFVLEVFTPQGLNIAARSDAAAHGPAVLSALRVRLLHAAVRALILIHRDPVWNESQFGTPANQEDEAGTLMTFSLLVIDGLRQLHLDIDRAREEQYFEIWKKVGRLLGIEESLIPANVAEAEQLMALIKERQIDAPIRNRQRNDLGIAMTRSLLDFIVQAMPAPMRLFGRRLPASVMRFFLPSAPVDVAGSLGVPRTYVLDELVRLWFAIEARVTKFRFFDALNKLVFKEWGGRDPRARGFLQLSRFLNRRLVLHIASIDRNKDLAQPKPAAHLQLLGWENEWAFQQADFVTRTVRRVRRRLRSRR